MVAVAFSDDTVAVDARPRMKVFYQRLAEEGDVSTLARFALYDERAFAAGSTHPATAVLPCFQIDHLRDPPVARMVANGQCYAAYAGPTLRHFIPICSALARYNGAAEGSSLSQIVGNAALYEEHRLPLFNFSETFRHLLLSRSLFAQRGTIRAFSYMMADDFLGDATALLQYKTDVMTYVNRVFTDTPDLVSWRFSVRAMGLAGGYNEDRHDVDKTEAFCHIFMSALPDFAFFYALGLGYALVRQRPNRTKGIVPLRMSRARARFAACITGTLGVMNNALLDYRVQRVRQQHEEKYGQEMRLRTGAKRTGRPFQEDRRFDNLDDVTNRIWRKQRFTYGLTAAVLLASVVPMPHAKFPAFMGDVVWRFPWIPRWFPALVGMPCASKCFIPYIVAPFLACQWIKYETHKTPLADYYVQLRYNWFRRFRETDLDRIDSHSGWGIWDVFFPQENRDTRTPTL